MISARYILIDDVHETSAMTGYAPNWADYDRQRRLLSTTEETLRLVHGSITATTRH